MPSHGRILQEISMEPVGTITETIDIGTHQGILERNVTNFFNPRIVYLRQEFLSESLDDSQE